MRSHPAALPDGFSSSQRFNTLYLLVGKLLFPANANPIRLSIPPSIMHYPAIPAYASTPDVSVAPVVHPPAAHRACIAHAVSEHLTRHRSNTLLRTGCGNTISSLAALIRSGGLRKSARCEERQAYHHPQHNCYSRSPYFKHRQFLSSLYQFAQKSKRYTLLRR